MAEKKQVLLYGDSNTWGFDVKTYQKTGEPLSRFDENIRFGGILRHKLASLCNIVEEGLPGRTTILAGPIAEYNSGKYYLLPCLKSHAPIDLVVLLLGTNDMQSCYSGAGIEELINIIKFSKCKKGDATPKILVVSPIAFGKALEKSEFAPLFNREMLEERMKLIPTEYKKVADREGCFFMDGALFACAGDEDSVHLDAQNHKKLADVLEIKIKEILL